MGVETVVIIINACPEMLYYNREIEVSMGKYTKKKNGKKESVTESLYILSKYLLNLIICVYMLLILVGLPFYNEEGFVHIGTDKATFFKQSGLKTGMFLVPVFMVCVVLKVILYWKEQNKGRRKALNLSRMWEYCREKLSVTDWCVLTYGVSVILSYLFSDFKEAALWGADGWFMGMIPQLMLVAVYFLVSRAWIKRRWMVLLIFPVSAVVFALGFLNRFGIYPFDMQIENPQFISTIGNINWYCGYMVLVFFAGFFLLWQVEWESWWQKLLIMAYVGIGFATLVTHGSSSGVLTMGVMFLVFFRLSASDGRRMELFWLEMVIFSLVCLGIFLLRTAEVLEITYVETTTELLTNTMLPVIMTIVSVMIYVWVKISNQKQCYPQKLFRWVTTFICGGVLILLGGFVVLMVVNTLGGGMITKMIGMSQPNFLTFSPTWGSNRGATWMAGVLCFVEQDWLHKLFGSGPDCMVEFLYRQGSAELLSMVRECFGNLRLTNAHNEWLTTLVNMGLMGFVSYVGMMVTAIRRMIGSSNHNMIAGAMGFCLLAYTINNMFSFQQSIGLSTMFILLAVGENYLRVKN